jgi:3-(methylthio)propanoyl-CoA dehydrogenase
VPQHDRDARIAASYQGTNGLQAMDLNGRKLPLRGGGAVTDLLSVIAMLDPALNRYPQLASIEQNMGEAVTILADTTNWIMRHGVEDPLNAMAGATPYLRMFGLTLGGWVLAKSALAAAQLLEDGAGDKQHLEAKIATARFYCEQILPGVKGLQGPVSAGYETFFAISPEYLAN